MKQEAGFSPGGMLLRLNQQTYALTAVTYQRHRIFQRTTSAETMIALLFRYRDEGRYLLHGFAVMPDHVHVLLTPAQSMERCVQCIKGGFSFAIRNHFLGNVWQDGHHEHRIRGKEDFDGQLLYIANNPTRKQYEDYEYVHTHFADKLDAMPEYLRG